MDLQEIRETLKAMFGGENKPITDGNYDQSLAVKCINGTFVGKKTENIIAYKGIPFVGQQPVGELRWKAPVDVTMSLRLIISPKPRARTSPSFSIRVKTACI